MPTSPLVASPRAVRRRRGSVPSSILFTLPALAPEEVPTGPAQGWRLPRLARWMAVCRPGLYWCEPRWGTRAAEIPPETQCLVWQRTDGTCGALLPLIDGDLVATAQGCPAGDAFGFALRGVAPHSAPRPVRVAAAAAGADAPSAVRAALLAARDALGTFRLREEKERPAFLNDLGWCTWDAFYAQVDAPKVRRGLASFARGGLVPGFTILDDGWLDTRGDYLVGFGAHPRKFPRGLAPLAAVAKKAGVRHFGVWHAFPGYWAGLDPAGPLAARYCHHRQTGNIRPWNPDETRELVRVADDDIARFYHDFHRTLRAAGVDLVKVDGQSSLERFTAGQAGRATTMARWQEALQGAVAVHFRNQAIHCMCNGSDVAYHLASTNVWRNSDDYFPRRGPEQQQMHLVRNAFNALWSAGFAWPDWDMFQSHGIAAAFHGAARALSGGPVYVSDHPGRQDFALLRRIALPDGRVPAWDRPALPTPGSVFTDPLHTAAPLVLHNRRGPLAALGLFHCWLGHEGRSIAATWRAADVPDFPARVTAVAYDPHGGQLRLCRGDTRHSDTLAPLGWQLWTLAPVGPSGAASLGLAGLWAGAAAFERIVADEPGQLAVELRHRGPDALFYTPQRPHAVFVDGRRTPSRRRADGLLTVPTSAVSSAGPVAVRLVFRHARS